jgi:hypothetical protein
MTSITLDSEPVLTFFTKYWPLILPIAVVVAGGLITGFFAVINRRGEARTKQKASVPPTWPEMWARIDALDARVDKLEKENETLRREKGEIFAHVVTLERMIPEPPPRPRWELHALPE